MILWFVLLTVSVILTTIMRPVTTYASIPNFLQFPASLAPRVSRLGNEQESFLVHIDLDNQLPWFNVVASLGHLPKLQLLKLRPQIKAELAKSIMGTMALHFIAVGHNGSQLWSVCGECTVHAATLCSI